MDPLSRNNSGYYKFRDLEGATTDFHGISMPPNIENQNQCPPPPLTSEMRFVHEHVSLQTTTGQRGLLTRPPVSPLCNSLTYYQEFDKKILHSDVSDLFGLRSAVIRVNIGCSYQRSWRTTQFLHGPDFCLSPRWPPCRLDFLLYFMFAIPFL